MINLVDPQTKAPLFASAENSLTNPETGVTYQTIDDVWRMLIPEREQALRQFMREYETVRKGERRGSAESAYYRALPYEDLSGVMPEAWRIRAASYDCWRKNVSIGNRVIDLGAGNGWLSGRLASENHDVAAVDLMTNALDGLAAVKHYPSPFLAVQAEFDHLPFADQSADTVLFNASLHYSTNFEATLREALRVLVKGGTLSVIDTPIYRSAESGHAMVREREAAFKMKHGFPSNALASENFLTTQRLTELENALGLKWQQFKPNYGFKWAIKPLRAKLRGHREPASFRVLVATN